MHEALHTIYWIDSNGETFFHHELTTRYPNLKKRIENWAASSLNIEEELVDFLRAKGWIEIARDQSNMVIWCDKRINNAQAQALNIYIQSHSPERISLQGPDDRRPFRIDREDVIPKLFD